MAADTSTKRFSNLAHKYPSFQDGQLLMLNGYKWMDSRRNDDNAEGLWRVHDKLYELGDFVDKHPGGKEWLQLTKGTDITESFEVHHIHTERVEQVLTKFYVRDAAEPRNVRLTFHDTGFYRTFKRRIADKMQTIDRRPEFRSKLTIDALLVATFVLLFVAVRLASYVALVPSALMAALTIIAAHNFFHRSNNFRMLYFNLAFLSYREWRISHAMSHHLYPNSLLDLEVTLFEPFLCWVTGTKNWFQRYASWLYGPVVYSLLCFDQALKRLVLTLSERHNLYHWGDAVPLAVPVFMYAVAAEDFTLGMVLKMWMAMVSMASFYIGFVGLNAGHHNHHVVHDGDELRNEQRLDWGLYTLDTVIDNSDLRAPLLALTHFGHHAMHHLLPTVDHGLLPQLEPVLYETMREFDTELCQFPLMFHIVGQLKQLARVQPTDYRSRLRMRLAYWRQGTI